jgi:hypothetical protein
MMSSVGDV